MSLKGSGIQKGGVNEGSPKWPPPSQRREGAGWQQGQDCPIWLEAAPGTAGLGHLRSDRRADRIEQTRGGLNYMINFHGSCRQWFANGAVKARWPRLPAWR